MLLFTSLKNIRYKAINNSWLKLLISWSKYNRESHTLFIITELSTFKQVEKLNVSNIIRNFSFELIKDQSICEDTTKRNIENLIGFYSHAFIQFRDKYHSNNINNL